MKANSGHTILGYSKNNFGCCAHHNECKLGRLSCVIEDRDPEAKDYCMCYQRNHKAITIKKEQKKEVILPIDENGQLRLF